MKVGYLFRKSKPLFYSIEKVFESIIPSLEDKVELARFYIYNPNEGLLALLRQIRLLRSRKDLDIFHITGEIYFIAPFLPANKLVLTFHDCNYIRNRKGVKGNLIYFFWFWLPVRRAKHIIAISEQTRQDIIRYSRCSPDKITVVPNPVNSIFSYTPREIRGDKPVLLQVGTRWNKNVDRVLSAIKGLPCKLVIIGPLSKEQSEYVKAQQLDVENLVDLNEAELLEQYKRSDILVFASLSEGFGLPIIEAQAIGRPVITSNISPMKEVAGDGAILVDPENEDAIRGAIQQVMADPALRSDLVRKGQANVVQYQPPQIAQRYLDVYRKIRGV